MSDARGRVRLPRPRADGEASRSGAGNFPLHHRGTFRRCSPTTSFRAFLTTITDAVDLAAAGDPAAGYEVLLAGQQRAEELHAEGLSWAEELVGRYLDARERFAARWGVGGEGYPA